MEFWLSYNNFQEKLQLPVNPGEFRVKVGNKNETIEILSLGEANMPGLESLSEIEIESFFPANYAPYCAYRDIPNPYDAVNLIEKWRKLKKPIRFIITETPVNLACLIENFEYGEKGGTRDVTYTLSLKEYRFIYVRTSAEATTSQRPDTKAIPQTYVVKPGDTLFGIAKAVYGDGSRWKDIYNANKVAIGPDPSTFEYGIKLVIPA